MMRRALLAIVLALVSTNAFAQNQQTFPRVRVTFNGSADLNSLDLGGWTRLRATTFVPPVSAPGEARWYFDGTSIWISENGGAWRIIGAGNGTVTSVGLALPASIFTVSGSPVTTTGTLTGSLATQTANTLFAGPTTGVAAAPTFRSMVLADIPDGLITFGKWNGNGCAANEIPKRNAGNTAWICSSDATSPGGTSWLTTGNTLGAAGSVMGSVDAFDWALIRGNTTVATIAAGAINVGPAQIATSGLFTSNRSGSNVIGFATGSTSAGMQTGFMTFDNRTSALPAGAASQTHLVMDNGVLKANQANGGWVPVLNPNSFVNGGNSFGAAASIGTNDAFTLSLEAGGVPFLTGFTTGNAQFEGNLLVTASANNQLELFQLWIDQRVGPPTTPGGGQTACYMDSGDDTVRCNEAGRGWHRVVNAAPYEYQFQADSGPTGGTWTNMPAALTEYQGASRHRIAIDLTNATEVRIVTSQDVAGFTGCELRAEYSTNGTTWASLGASANTPAVSCAALPTSKAPRGTWVDIATGAKADVYVRLMGINGDGIVDPIFQRIAIQVR